MKRFRNEGLEGLGSSAAKPLGGLWRRWLGVVIEAAELTLGSGLVGHWLFVAAAALPSTQDVGAVTRVASMGIAAFRAAVERQQRYKAVDVVVVLRRHQAVEVAAGA